MSTRQKDLSLPIHFSAKIIDTSLQQQTFNKNTEKKNIPIIFAQIKVFVNFVNWASIFFK